jgi:hypothetical protein
MGHVPTYVLRFWLYPLGTDGGLPIVRRREAIGWRWQVKICHTYTLGYARIRTYFQLRINLSSPMFWEDQT